MTDPELIIDFYSGPRGWSEGLRHLGLADVGIEWEPVANATARAAGHQAIQADCTTWPTAHLAGRVRLVIGSPPCTAFSMAGKGAGREFLDELVDAMRRGDWHAPIRTREPVTVWAPLDMGRVIEECRPDAIALEQVPPCLPLWEALAVWLRAQGYSVWVGVVNAADFGVPQTRRRAILLASRVRPMTGLVPTHDRDPQPTLFGPELQPWVSMAQALGWGITDRPSATVIGGSDDGGRRPLDGGAHSRELYRDAYEEGRWEGPWAVGFPRRADHQEATEDGFRARDFRSIDEPAFAVTKSSRSWVAVGRGPRPGDEAGDNVDEGFDPEQDPAQTVTPRVDRWRLNAGQSESQSNRAVRSADEPAPTIMFGHDAASWRWEVDAEVVLDRNATNADGSPVPPVPIDQPAPTIVASAAQVPYVWRDVSGGLRTYPAWDRGDDEVLHHWVVPTLWGGLSLGMWPLCPTEQGCAECLNYDIRGEVDGPWHSRLCSCWRPAGELVDVVLDRRTNSKAPGWQRALAEGRTVPMEPTVTVPVDRPAPTITGAANAAWRDRRNDQSESGEVDPDWPLDRPATTLAGRDLVTDPGANANRFNGVEKSRNDGYRITIGEALVLQSFRPDHPVQGSRTAQFQQVGNAVPPRLAAHLCAAVLGLDPPTFDPHPGDRAVDGDLDVGWAADRPATTLTGDPRLGPPVHHGPKGIHGGELGRTIDTREIHQQLDGRPIADTDPL